MFGTPIRENASLLNNNNNNNNNNVMAMNDNNINRRKTSTFWQPMNTTASRSDDLWQIPQSNSFGSLDSWQYYDYQISPSSSNLDLPHTIFTCENNNNNNHSNMAPSNGAIHLPHSTTTFLDSLSILEERQYVPSPMRRGNEGTRQARESLGEITNVIPSGRY